MRTVLIRVPELQDSIVATEDAGLTVLLVLLKGNIRRIFMVSECLCFVVKKTLGFVKVWTSLPKINRYCTARVLKKVLISKRFTKVRRLLL